jgi:hypothetical protein
MTRFRVITQLADVIDHLEAGFYAFEGHYWLESAPELPKSLHFNCEFAYDEKALVADEPESLFEVRIPFLAIPPNRPSVELFIRGLGHTKGALSFTDGNALFVGTNEHATIFAHVCMDERGTITIVGTVESDGVRQLFSMNGSLGTTPASIAHVRALRRRA